MRSFQENWFYHSICKEAWGEVKPINCKIRGRLLLGLQEKIVISSAYNETIFMGFPNFIPWSSSWLLKNKAKGSITIVKRKEDNGQPCLVPWCHFKKGEFKLLVCTHLARILHNIFNPIFMKVFLKWRVWVFVCFVVVIVVDFCYCCSCCGVLFIFFCFVLVVFFLIGVWFCTCI